MKSVKAITIMQRPGLLALLVMIATVTAACPNPSIITSFTAEPDPVCPGGTITLNWTAEGDSANIGGIGDVPATGSTTTTVGSTDESYTLTVNGTDSSMDPMVATALARVNVITSPESFSLNLSPLCSGRRFIGWGGDFMELNNGETAFPSGVTISTVQDGGSRITLTHAGLSDVLAPFEIKSTWSGRTPAGPWDATAPVISLECPGSLSGGDVLPPMTLFVVVECP